MRLNCRESARDDLHRIRRIMQGRGRYPWLAFLSSERSGDGFGTDRSPRTGRNSSGILSRSDSALIASTPRIHVGGA
jgi:hypothetical protein